MPAWVKCYPCGKWLSNNGCWMNWLYAEKAHSDFVFCEACSKKARRQFRKDRCELDWVHDEGMSAFEVRFWDAEVEKKFGDFALEWAEQERTRCGDAKPPPKLLQ